ncbi:MAG: VUT family protein [Alphaproteobacteria bacterium]|nr:VUT family protein [Alphaproteobacteria bacterium]
MIGQSSRLAVQGGEIVSHAPSRAHWIARALRVIASLAPPVVASVATLALAWQMRGTPLYWFDGILSPPGRPELYPSHWLTVGHAIVPVVFLISNLVNRRSGEHIAIMHVILSWAAAALMALVVLSEIAPQSADAGHIPGTRMAGAYLGAMMLGQLAGVFVFDRTRGVEWWRAPLYSALTASFLGVFLFYVIAFAGGDWIWLNRMSVDAGLKAAMSFALLVPYLVLRPVVRPLGGLGGY